MTRGIYFSVKNDSEGFRLPVNPERVPVENQGSGEGYKIAKLGSVNIPKDVELKEFTVESFFPAQEYHFLETAYMPPTYYIEKLEKWMIDKEPVRYMYVDGSFTINEIVTIENFPYEENDGSGDVYFTLELKKYVDFGPKKMSIVTKKDPKAPASAPKKTAVKKAAPPRQNTKTVPQTYALVKGDSLWKIAQKQTGNGANYKELQKLNGIKDSDLRKLPIGMKVKVPDAWKKKTTPK